jgi:hypothetical protein
MIHYLYDCKYGRERKALRRQIELAKKGNPPGTKRKPPTKCGIGYNGRTTQLNNNPIGPGSIVPQKRSERI